MWREAVGVCVARERVVAVVLRQARSGAAPELVGWHSVPEVDWFRGGVRLQKKLGMCAGARIGVSLPVAEVFVCGRQRASEWAQADHSAVKECCRRELRTVEPLCVDVAAFSDSPESAEQKVAAAARQSSIERCRERLSLTGVPVAVVTPELAALFALLREIEPLAAQVSSALLHLEEDRALAGVFAQGVLISQREYAVDSRQAGAEAALQWIRAEQPTLSLVYISGLPLEEPRLAVLPRGTFQLVQWDPCDAAGMRRLPGEKDGASLAIPTALAFCALEPETPTRINFVRGEYAAAEKARRRSRHFRLGVRTALVASMTLSALLFFDSLRQRAARTALSEFEASMVSERIAHSSAEHDLLAERELLKEIQAAGLLPLRAGESLRSLVAALPKGLQVSALYLDNSTVRMSGSSKAAFRVPELAEAVSQLLPGATVEVSEQGALALHAERFQESARE